MLYSWCHPEDTVLLCTHVLQHGAGQWQLLAGHFPECPAAHVIAPLKWHALQLQQECRSPTVKRYSDWELCLMHLAHQLGAAQNEGKARVCKALSSWLPGRTAAAIKQAYAGCTDARVAQLLQQNGWPADMLGLLEVWPGPGPRHQGRPAEKDRQLAAHILAQIQAEEAAQLMQMPAAAAPAWPVPPAAAAAAFGAAAAAAAAALEASVAQLHSTGVPAAGPHLGPQAAFASSSLLQPGCLEGMPGQLAPQHAAAQACCAGAALNEEQAAAAAVQCTPLQLAEQPQAGAGAEWGPPWDLGSATAAAGQGRGQQAWAVSPQDQQQQQQVLPAPALAAAAAGATVSTHSMPGGTAAGAAAAAAAASSSGVLLPMQLQASPAHPAASLDPQVSFSCGLELPEGDPALRQALEQHLDSMLAGLGPGPDAVVEPPGQGLQPLPELAACPCSFEELTAQVVLRAAGESPAAAAGADTTAAAGAVSDGPPGGFSLEPSPTAVTSSPAAGAACGTVAAAAPMSSGQLPGVSASCGSAGVAAAAVGAHAMWPGHLQGSRAVPGCLPGVVGHKRPWQQCTQLQQTPTGQGMSADSLAGRDTGPGPCSLHYPFVACTVPGARRAGSEPGQQLSPASTDIQLQQEQLAHSGGIHRRPVRRGVSAGVLSCTARAGKVHSGSIVMPQLPRALESSAAAAGASSSAAAGSDQHSGSDTTQPPCSGWALGGGLGVGVDMSAQAAGVMQTHTGTGARQCAPGDACMLDGLHCQERCGVVGCLQQQLGALQQRQLSVEAEVASLKLLLHQLVPPHGT